jgi:hypothetical protein
VLRVSALAVAMIARLSRLSLGELRTTTLLNIVAPRDAEMDRLRRRLNGVRVLLSTTLDTPRLYRVRLAL